MEYDLESLFELFLNKFEFIWVCRLDWSFFFINSFCVVLIKSKYLFFFSVCIILSIEYLRVNILFVFDKCNFLNEFWKKNIWIKMSI